MSDEILEILDVYYESVSWSLLLLLLMVLFLLRYWSSVSTFLALWELDVYRSILFFSDIKSWREEVLGAVSLLLSLSFDGTLLCILLLR